MTDYNSRRYALLNRWDPSHLDKALRLLPLEPGSTLLEVGAGSGHLTRRLAERGVDVLGIDANPNAAAVATDGLVQTMRAEALDLPDSSFDYLISVHAIEHIPALEAAFLEMHRVMRADGQVLLIYPAEPIQGMFAIPTSVILHGNPFKAREVHCHKLWPAKVRRMVEPLGWVETHREFNLWKSPQFVSRFQVIK